jgi:1-acyl-sn-glycerol-3-phosphate acyltransferase
MGRLEPMEVTEVATLGPCARRGGVSVWLAALLMNLTVYPLLVLWTLLGLGTLPLTLPLTRLVTGWSTQRGMRYIIWVYGQGWLLIMRPFIRFETQGLDPEKLRAPAILVVNHLSFFDTYCMALLPCFDVNFAVRSWPFRMIFYGFIMRRAGYLDVESMNWREALAAGRRVLEQPASQLFFPEGHRSRDGRLQRFYSGAFRLATETGTKLIPLCLTGTDTLLPPGRFWLRPARVRLQALDPVDPADFPGENGHVAMRKAVKERMRRHLEGMEKRRC